MTTTIIVLKVLFKNEKKCFHASRSKLVFLTNHFLNFRHTNAFTQKNKNKTEKYYDVTKRKYFEPIIEF